MLFFRCCAIYIWNSEGLSLFSWSATIRVPFQVFHLDLDISWCSLSLHSQPMPSPGEDRASCVSDVKFHMGKIAPDDQRWKKRRFLSKARTVRIERKKRKARLRWIVFHKTWFGLIWDWFGLSPIGFWKNQTKSASSFTVSAYQQNTDLNGSRKISIGGSVILVGSWHLCRCSQQFSLLSRVCFRIKRLFFFVFFWFWIWHSHIIHGVDAQFIVFHDVSQKIPRG